MKELVEQILANTFEDYSNNTADSKEVSGLFKKMGLVPDEAYMSFLQKINGFELNGLNFYGTKEIEEKYILAIEEQNSFWSIEIPKIAKYLLIGDGDMIFICYDPVERKYLLLDKADAEPLEEFANFDQLWLSPLLIGQFSFGVV